MVAELIAGNRAEDMQEEDTLTIKGAAFIPIDILKSESGTYVMGKVVNDIMCGLKDQVLDIFKVVECEVEVRYKVAVDAEKMEQAVKEEGDNGDKS